MPWLLNELLSRCEVAEKTIDLLLGFYLPRPLFGIGCPAVHALRLRGRIATVSPFQQRTVLRTQMRRPIYPNSYRIDDLGPP